MTQDSSAKGPAPSPTPTFSQFASFTSPPASKSATPQPGMAQQSQYQPPPQPAASSDPFAALGASFSSPSHSPAPPPKPTVSNDDDEWNFASSLPPEAPSKPKEHRDTVSNTSIKIEYIAVRSTGGVSMKLAFAFTNNTALPVSELHFQLAVTKVSHRFVSPFGSLSMLPMSFILVPSRLQPLS